MTIDGEEVQAHVANSGRLSELLTTENKMLLAPAPADAGRKTAYDLALVGVDHVLVSADARLPNRIVKEAVERGRIATFRAYRELATEVRFEDSRLDFMLSGSDGRCYVEVKSVTLVEAGTALFPMPRPNGAANTW